MVEMERKIAMEDDEASVATRVSLDSYFDDHPECVVGLSDSLDDANRRFGDMEFLISEFFHPSLIDRCCAYGVFPMSVNFGTPWFALKLHHRRCIVRINNPQSSSSDELIGSYHLSKKTRKELKKGDRCPYRVTINSEGDVVDVFSLIQKSHGENWLCSELRKCFMHMFFHSSNYSTKIVIMAVRRVSDDAIDTRGELVAGELGFVVGDIYTSCTGAFSLSGAGTLQLALLKVILRQVGCSIWDLGMEIPYKLEMLKAATISRSEWLNMIGQHRLMPNAEIIEKLAHFQGVVASLLLG